MILFIYFSLLFISSIEDYKYHKVHTRWILAMFLLGLFRLIIEEDGRWVTIALTCICFFLFYILYCFVRWSTKKYSLRLSFGGADVRLIPCMMMVQGWENALMGVFLGLLVAMILLLFSKDKRRELPLVPFMMIGCIFITIVYG